MPKLIGKSEPARFKEKTIKRQVSGATGIDNPVVIPLVIVPTGITPVNTGASVTIAPGTGVKISLGIVELHNCAVIVSEAMPEPVISIRDAVLKYAAIDVIVPSRGAENAILRLIPKLLERFIIPPVALIPDAESPNPRRPTSSGKPFASALTKIGEPDA